MTAKANQDFRTFSGDDVQPIFTVRDAAGSAIDISSVSEINWWAKQNNQAGETDILSLSKSAGDISFVTDGTDGKFQVDITAAMTANLDGWYNHFASITDAYGDKTTVSVGRWQVGPRPNFSYSSAKLSSTPLYQVRFLIGDTVQRDAQLADEEILFALDQWGSNVYAAGAQACQAMAAKYSREVSVTSPGEIRQEFSDKAKAYAARAVELQNLFMARGGGAIFYAGGISVQDKINVQDDTDRVQPQFNIGMTDNLVIPLPPVGNETPGNPSINPGA